MNELQTLGPVGCYVDDGNVISFQLGERIASDRLYDDPEFTDGRPKAIPVKYLTVDRFKVLRRGVNNRQCEEIEQEVGKNRLWPKLIEKQINMLYGRGPAIYIDRIDDKGKVARNWVTNQDIQNWLEGWVDAGLEMDYKNFALSVIERFYNFQDYFVRWRFYRGRVLGLTPFTGCEILENKDCRLATDRDVDDYTKRAEYRDFRFVMVGNWNICSGREFKTYPRLNLQEIDTYQYAAVSHHRASAIGDFYGRNKTYDGTRPWLIGANASPEYINSFLKNSLAAKIHVVIPNAWMEMKRQQIRALCEENATRKEAQKALLKYSGIEIGTEYRESSLMLYVKAELKKLSSYLSGIDNQGKAYASFSFKTDGKEEERWKIETVDLKYKEYIESLIAYDKRADEVLLSAVGLDSSLSSVSKDGVISKSGADVYYNFLIYLLTLTPADEKCCEAFNLGIRINFPELYRQGYRIGFFREVPQRQESLSQNDRLSNTQP